MDLWLGHDFHFICRVFLRPISDNLTRHARLRRREIGERRERLSIFTRGKNLQDEELKALFIILIPVTSEVSHESA